MDKTILKVAGIFAIVLGVLCCITIIGLIVGVPIIIGGMKFNDLSKLSDAEIEANKETILIWSIVFLFLCQLSGILGLVYYIFLNNDSNKNLTNTTKVNNTDKYDDLEKINKLYKDKVLTKEEYEKEKARILNN